MPPNNAQPNLSWGLRISHLNLHNDGLGYQTFGNDVFNFFNTYGHLGFLTFGL